MYKGRYNIASPWLQSFYTAVCVAVVLIFISTSYVKGKCFQYYIRLHTQLLGRGPERFQGNRMSLPPELRSPNTISQVVEDTVKHCHATKFCCCKLKKCVEKSRRQFSSTCCNNEMLLHDNVWGEWWYVRQRFSTCNATCCASWRKMLSVLLHL